LTVSEWRIHNVNDNITVALTAYTRRSWTAGGLYPPKLWKRLIFLLSTKRPLRIRAGEKHSGWMSADSAGVDVVRTSSRLQATFVCSVLPRCLIQMKDDPGHELSDADAVFQVMIRCLGCRANSDKDEAVKLFIHCTEVNIFARHVAQT